MHEKAKFVCFIYMQPPKLKLQICSNKHETCLVCSIFCMYDAVHPLSLKATADTIFQIRDRVHFPFFGDCKRKLVGYEVRKRKLGKKRILEEIIEP